MKLGLISDTHMPDRWKTLPERVFELFADVDLILHAGDVGELWVLDQLSASAPVIAVHGNDETAEAEVALPYLQTISAAGHRLVMTHAHYPDRTAELASRTNEWESKFERRANFAKAHGASICIFGHTHIPMDLHYQGIHLINPGAIASGNPWTKQVIQTVAVLTLEANQAPQLQHIELATGETHTPFFDARGFSETFINYCAPIFESDCMPHCQFIWNEIRPIDLPHTRDVFMTLCHEVWSGERMMIRTDELVKRFLGLDNPAVTDALANHPYFSKYI